MNRVTQPSAWQLPRISPTPLALRQALEIVLQGQNQTVITRQPSSMIVPRHVTKWGSARHRLETAMPRASKTRCSRVRRTTALPPRPPVEASGSVPSVLSPSDI